MIYKFETDAINGSVYMELLKQNDKILIKLDSVNSDTSLGIYLSEEKLYDLIGALHSIQYKLKSNIKNGRK